MKSSFAAFLILFIFFSTSCKKPNKQQEDTQPPQVTIYSPLASAHYTMFDTIHVSAYITDETKLTSVSVTLTDMNHAVVQGSVTDNPAGKSYTLSLPYVLSEYHINSGTYILQISASDGSNLYSAYQTITVTESPTYISGFCVVLKNDPTNIHRYDSLLSTQVYTYSIGFPYNGMKYGPYYRQLFVNGSTGGKTFKAYDTQTNQLAYSEQLTNSHTNFTCISTDGKKAFCGFDGGPGCDVFSYDPSNGSNSTSYRYNNNTYYPYYFTTAGAYPVAALKSKNAGQNDLLMAYYPGTGASFTSSFLTFNVLKVFSKLGSAVYVFGNDNTGQAVLNFFDPLSPGLSSASLPAGKLYDAVQVDNDNLILSIGNQLYGYRSSDHNIIPLSGAPAAISQKLFYTTKLNRLDAANNATISSYNYNPSTFSLVSLLSKNVSDSIIDFQTMTNK